MTAMSLAMKGTLSVRMDAEKKGPHPQSRTNTIYFEDFARPQLLNLLDAVDRPASVKSTAESLVLNKGTLSSPCLQD